MERACPRLALLALAGVVALHALSARGAEPVVADAATAAGPSASSGASAASGASGVSGASAASGASGASGTADSLIDQAYAAIDAKRVELHQQRDQLIGNPTEIEPDTIARMKNLAKTLVVNPASPTQNKPVTASQAAQAAASALGPQGMADLGALVLSRGFGLERADLNHLDGPLAVAGAVGAAASNSINAGAGGKIVNPKGPTGGSLAWKGAINHAGFGFKQDIQLELDGGYAFDASRRLEGHAAVLSLGNQFRPRALVGGDLTLGKNHVSTEAFYESLAPPSPSALELYQRGGRIGFSRDNITVTAAALQSHDNSGDGSQASAGIANSWKLGSTQISAGLSASRIVTPQPASVPGAGTPGSSPAAPLPIYDLRTARAQLGVTLPVGSDVAITQSGSVTGIYGCSLPSADIAVQVHEVAHDLSAILNASYDTRTHKGVMTLGISGPIEPFGHEEMDRRELVTSAMIVRDTLADVLKLQTEYLSYPLVKLDDPRDLDVLRTRNLLGHRRLDLKRALERLDATHLSSEKVIPAEDLALARRQAREDTFDVREY